jgi:hypothetical protein
MKKINKFLKLSSKDKCLLVEALLLLAVVTAGLFFFPFDFFMKQIDRLAKRKKESIPTKNFDSGKITWAVTQMSRYIPHARCLSKAITVKILLICHEDPVQLRIGIKKITNNSISAHAWVEHQGKIIIGNLSDLNQYHILAPLKGPKN